MKAALMVIDMQKEFYHDETQKSMISASEYINEVIPYFRNKKLPIVWVQHQDKEAGVIPGSRGFEIIDELKPLDGEPIIHKEYGNSFNKTDCGKILSDANIDTIIIAGFCAEQCVLSTYRGAEDLDLVPIILRNGIAGGNQENIGFVEGMSDIISYNALRKMLENG